MLCSPRISISFFKFRPPYPPHPPRRSKNFLCPIFSKIAWWLVFHARSTNLESEFKNSYPFSRYSRFEVGLLCNLAYFCCARTLSLLTVRFKGRIYVPRVLAELYSDFRDSSEIFIFLLHPNEISDFRLRRLFGRFPCFSYIF